MATKQKQESLSSSEVLRQLQEKGSLPSTARIIEKVIKRVGVEAFIDEIAREIKEGEGRAKRDFTKMFLELMVRNERNTRRIGDEEIRGLQDDQLEAMLNERFGNEDEGGTEPVA